MRAEHQALAARWFARLLDLLPVDAREVFPSQSLLDHIPALILEVSDYLKHPEAGAIAANTAILTKAQELGALRHQQQASLHQVLREYQLLNGILATFVLEEMEHLSVPPSAQESVAVIGRLHDAVNVLSHATVNEFVTLYTRTIAEQNERLEQFTRMAAHEWRQPLGTLQFGVTLLKGGELDAPRTERTLANLERNVQRLVELTRKLETLARIQNKDEDSPIVQEVSAQTVAEQAARQLREMADARGVTLTIGTDLPTLTVDVGRLELVFVNLLSNAVKYSDPAKPQRYVEVNGSGDETWCRLMVTDNGIGIPESALGRIFGRFKRAHTDHAAFAHLDGVGLGLSITDDCVKAMGGRIDVTSTLGQGTSFTLTLPRTPATAPIASAPSGAS